VVAVDVVLLPVCAVVGLGVVEPEEAFLQDRIDAVPEREREAQPLLIVRETREPVLSPTIRAGAGVLVGKVPPGIPTVSGVRPHRAPLAFAEVRPPAPPRHAL